MTKREQEIEFQQGLIDASQLKTCTNCVDWNKGTLICDKYDVAPPPEVIVVGCVTWEKIIPF